VHVWRSTILPLLFWKATSGYKLHDLDQVIIHTFAKAETGLGSSINLRWVSGEGEKKRERGREKFSIWLCGTGKTKYIFLWVWCKHTLVCFVVRTKLCVQQL